MVEPMYLTSLTLLGRLKHLGHNVCLREHFHFSVQRSKLSSFLFYWYLFFLIFNGEEAKQCKWVDTWCTACTSLTRTRKRESKKTWVLKIILEFMFKSWRQPVPHVCLISIILLAPSSFQALPQSELGHGTFEATVPWALRVFCHWKKKRLGCSRDSLAWQVVHGLPWWETCLS